MVYVDDMYKYETGNFRGMKMSHMVADTKEELIQMARTIGVNTKWIQKEGTVQEHFDICFSKRKKALAAGAKEITWKQLGERLLKLAKQKKNGRG